MGTSFQNKICENINNNKKEIFINIINKKILEAIQATKENIPGYFESTCTMRAGNSKEAKGSIFPGTDSADLEAILAEAVWRPYSHENIMTGCTAFKAYIAGKLGTIELDSLPGDTPVVLDDSKGTGKVSAVVSGFSRPCVDFTVIILGLEDGKEVVFTFHPGAPERPSVVDATDKHGLKVTASEALAMGLTIAKIA